MACRLGRLLKNFMLASAQNTLTRLPFSKSVGFGCILEGALFEAALPRSSQAALRSSSITHFQVHQPSPAGVPFFFTNLEPSLSVLVLYHGLWAERQTQKTPQFFDHACAKLPALKLANLVDPLQPEEEMSGFGLGRSPGWQAGTNLHHHHGGGRVQGAFPLGSQNHTFGQ